MMSWWSIIIVQIDSAVRASYQWDKSISINQCLVPFGMLRYHDSSVLRYVLVDAVYLIKVFTSQFEIQLQTFMTRQQRDSPATRLKYADFF